jgi:Na+/proline symporter
MASFHFIDYCIVAAYLVVVIALGKIAAKSATTGEGFSRGPEARETLSVLPELRTFDGCDGRRQHREHRLPAGRIGKVPAQMFHLFGTVGSSEFTGWTIAAVFFATMLTGHAGPGNMGIAGSARNEFAARFGAVAGTFGKRLMTVLWAFCGLIGIALFSEADRLADADLLWGTMSLKLLGPGFLGLMVAGVLAANMSTVASHAMASSGLFARNIYRRFRPRAPDAEIVRVARWTLVFVLVFAGLVSAQLSDVYTVLQFAMTMNVPFGASILLMFVWRRVTVAAVWIGVLGAAVVNILFPLAAQNISALTTHPALVVRAENAQGRPVPVYFENVVRTRPDDATSPLEGGGRLHTELLLLRTIGVDVEKLLPGGRLAGRLSVTSPMRTAFVFINHGAGQT